MLWLFASLGSTIAFTVISALDKILIHRSVPNSRTFIVMVGMTQFLMALCLLFRASWDGYTAGDAAIGLVSGLASGGYLTLMFWIMGRQDVSRVIPVTSTYPVFVAILAQAFLGERLSAWAWAGIAATVIGAALMSLGPTARAEDRGRGEALAFCLLMLASLGFGLSQFFSKLVADDMDVWTLMMWRAIGNGAVCVLPVIGPGGLSQTANALRRPLSVGLILFSEGGLVFVALLLLMLAIYDGPVSLVSTVMATRPLFIFALGALLSVGATNILNEPLEGRILALKALSIALSVGGVALVTLAQSA